MPKSHLAIILAALVVAGTVAILAAPDEAPAPPAKAPVLPKMVPPGETVKR